MTLTDPLALAQALIRAKSVTPEDGGAIALVEGWAKDLGFACWRLPFGAAEGRPEIQNLYARLGENGPNFCFAGHTDVVPAGTGWSVDPFAATVADGRLHGRGAADMKGAIACFLAAVARRLEQGPLAGSVSLVITGDEEGRALDGTGRVVDWLKARGETIDACLVGEPSNPVAMGEIMRVGRRGSVNFTLKVSGRQGHVAYPQRADNPIPRIIAMLGALIAQPLDQGSELFPPSSLVITSVDVGNPTPNVIPSEASARFNIRFNDHHTGASLEAWVRKTLDAIGGAYDLAVEVTGESFYTPPGPLTERLSAAVAAVTGRTPEPSTAGGISDARFFKGLCPVAEFGLVSATIHQVDEQAPLADLETLTEVYRRLLD